MPLIRITNVILRIVSHAFSNAVVVRFVVLLLLLFYTDVLLKKIIHNRIKQIGSLRFYKVAGLINSINLRLREDLHVL